MCERACVSVRVSVYTRAHVGMTLRPSEFSCAMYRDSFVGVGAWYKQSFLMYATFIYIAELRDLGRMSEWP